MTAPPEPPLPTAAPRPAPFYGWCVVAAAFTVLCVAFGVSYSFGAFFDSLEREFSASRASVSFAFSLGLSLSFLLGVVGGRAGDRFGPQPVILGGLAILALGTFCASRASSLSWVYVTYGAGIGLGLGLSYVPALGAVQRWFVRRRGLASGLTVAGIGVGTLAVPPLAAVLIDAFGWRDALAILGAGAFLIGAAAARYIAGDPARRGLTPDGDPPACSSARAAPPHGIRIREAVGSMPFLRLYLAQFCLCLGVFIPFVHLVPYAEDAGLGRAAGITGVGLLGLGSTVGRFAMGGLADRLGRRRTLVLLFVGIAASFGLWHMAREVWGLGVFALVFGICYGGYVALVPALIADFFAGPDVGAIIGAQYTGLAVGSLVGPVLAGWSYDSTGAYTLTFLVCALASLVAAGFVWILPEPAPWRTEALAAQARAGTD
jgi:MFS family permease